MCCVDIPALCLCLWCVCVMRLDCVAFVYMSESLHVCGVVPVWSVFIVLCLWAYAVCVCLCLWVSCVVPVPSLFVCA